MDKFYCETQLSDRISKTPEGFLVCHDVPITTAGDMYYSPDQFGDGIKAKNGHVRVAKNIEDIHSDDTIRSFEGKPITLGHPKDEAGNGVFVTPENSRGLARGTLQNVRPGSGKNFNFLLADFVITDKEAIDLVESGTLREVSCGYNYDAANIQDGFFEQTNIRGNHVALVPRGRAGPQCAIFDSKEENKDMSLKSKLHDALKIFSTAIDEAVPDEVAGDMATKNEDSKAEAEKPQAADESPMQQAMENMAFMNLDARVSNMERMLSELVEKVTGAMLGKAADLLESDGAMDSAEPEETKPLEEEAKEEVKEEALDADTISKAEILAPNIVKTGGNLKKRALDECYKTESGKRVITAILSGKSFDSVDSDLLFSATASLLSTHRSDALKKSSAFDSSKTTEDYRSGAVINRKHAEMHARLERGLTK